MRLSRVCWSCSVAFAAQGAWAEASDKNRRSGTLEKSYDVRSFPWPRLFGQERLDAAVEKSPVDPALPEITETRIVVATITESHPRVTEAPLVRRKLGSNKWDAIHEGIQGQKRDVTSCPVDYPQICPASVGGGCCPSDRVCGTSSCYATSAAPASACSQAGYVGCRIDQGGGCCPSGYACEVNGCTASAGVSYSEACGVSSYLCPASVNYGCCPNSMGCGYNQCYLTAVETYTLVDTITTTSAGHSTTITSTIVGESTPAAPSVAAQTPDNVIPKYAPTAIAKESAGSTSTSGGLTTPQLDGIIAGAVGILVIILIVAFIILRRLHKVNKAVEASRSSSSGHRSGRSRPRPAPLPEVDNISIDPLMITPSEYSQSARHPSQPSAIHTTTHEVDGSSPPLFHSPFTPGSPPYSNYGRGYAPVATSETSSGYRNPSLESTPGHYQSPSDYFGISPDHPELRDQNLRFGHYSPLSPPNLGRRPSAHGRQWSDASDRSGFSQGSSVPSELDAGSDGVSPVGGVPQSKMQRALHGLGMGRLLSTRRKHSSETTRSRASSDPKQQPVLTGRPARSDWNMSPVGLGHIAEAGESRLEIEQMTQAPGLTNAQLREMTLLEQQAYERKEQEEFEQARQAMQQAQMQQGTELRDDDLGNRTAFPLNDSL